MKKLFLFLSLCLLFILPAQAESGICGAELSWELNGSTLTISGSGPMDDFEDETGAPWYPYRDQIESVTMKGVTYVGNCAFTDYDRLRSVDFGGSLTQLGPKSFHDCDALVELSLPKTFKVFGEESLSSCDNLTSIHCAGGFPSFRANSLWSTYTEIFYPEDAPWPENLVNDLESAFQGRIRFLPSGGADPYHPTEEPTEAPTTEAATEAATEPATEATTEPTTIPTEASQPETTAVTVSPTILSPTEETILMGSAAADQPQREEGSSVTMAIAFITMAFAVVGIAFVVLLQKFLTRGEEKPKGRFRK